jgi:hypothetical protein
MHIGNKDEEMDKTLSFENTISRQNILYQLPVHIRQPEAPALEFIGQPLMVDAH